MVFRIHDITARLGIGHTTVWLYDNLTWTLPRNWELIGDKTYDQYLLEHELYIAKHQMNYYANLAYEYQWVILNALVEEDEDEDEDSKSVVYEMQQLKYTSKFEDKENIKK